MPERLLIFPSQNKEHAPNVTFHAKFEGFSKKQAKIYKEYMESTLLPMDNIENVVQTDTPNGVMGFWDPESKTLGVSNKIDKYPPIAKFETVPHEIGHSLTPFKPENAHLYGSRKDLERAQEHTIAVAKQSLATNRFLNPYQAYLAGQLKEGQIDEARFVEETSGIMIGLRFTNPKHLEQVDAAQKAQLRKLNASEQAVDIITPKEKAEKGQLSGVDSTLNSLIPGLKTKESIDNHVFSLKKRFRDGKKLSNSSPLPLAA